MMVLAGPQPAVRLVLSTTGIDSLVAVRDDLDQALAEFAGIAV